MQSYLFVGGDHDGLNSFVADDVEFVQWSVGVTDFEVYARETLGCDAVTVTIFRHESLTPMQVLDRMLHHYKAWCVNRPGGRR